MEVMVIGLGSMGKRRIRLLKKYDESIKIYGIDTKLDRRKACFEEFNIPTYENLNDVISSSKVSCAFICTSPLTHHQIISQCLDSGLHVFSELNLVADGYDSNIIKARINNLVLFLSSTFLYREEIKKIKTLVSEASCLLNYSYHVGQYLPDWHPWENYKDFFVGDCRSSGCREIFAIELPWLTDVFGDIVSIEVVKSKISKLDVNYNDSYITILSHESGHKGALIVNVVSRKAVRNLEIFGEQLYLQWNGKPNGLIVYDFISKQEVSINLYEDIDRLDNYSEFIVENAYLDEIESFFHTITHNCEPIYTFEKDKRIIDIIDTIEG